MAAFRRIQIAVGGDAYLDDLIAEAYLAGGRREDVRAMALRSIRREPTLDEGYWTLLRIALAERDHESTSRLLSILERRFGWTFQDLTAGQPYADFVKSEAYRRGMAARPATAEVP